MNMLANLTTQADIQDEQDRVGGSGGPVESGAYRSTVVLAYLSKSSGGALALNLHLKTEQGRELRQQLWMTSGTAKGGKNYYEKDGVKNYLPGFLLANSLCLLTVGKEISELETETKVVKLYNFETKSEQPTSVEMLTDLLGKEIVAGVIKQTVDKNVKDAAGNYVPSGETRDENEIDKFFRARDNMTVAEIRAQATEASFIGAWVEKNSGVTRNKAKGAAGTAGAPGAPAAAAAPAQAKPRQSLFQ